MLVKSPSPYPLREVFIFGLISLKMLPFILKICSLVFTHRSKFVILSDVCKGLFSFNFLEIYSLGETWYFLYRRISCTTMYFEVMVYSLISLFMNRILTFYNFSDDWLLLVRSVSVSFHVMIF